MYIDENSAYDPLASLSESALYWHRFGFNPVPVVPGSTQPAVDIDSWLVGLSAKKIANHWGQCPDHEVGCIPGDDTVVFSVDSRASRGAFYAIGSRNECLPNMAVKTAKGTQYFSRLVNGVCATSSSRVGENSTDCIGMATGHTLVMLPPSPGVVQVMCVANDAGDLTEVSQAFIDEVNQYNASIVQVATAPATGDSIVQPMATDVATQVLPEPLTAPDVPPQSEAEIISRLAALSPVDYDRVRKEEAKALGIQVKTLDDMVKAERNQDSASSRMPFQDVMPWSDPVSPADLFDEVAETISRFIVLDANQADAATLWVAHTYLTAEADTSPLAIINAPEKACAKTLFQTVLGRMAYRPLPASNASLSALFRAVESWKPTLLIDEADTFFRDNAELHGMVNAGYNRGGFVLRSESSGDSFEPRMFSVYGAKSIAGISLEKHLPDSTMSRGIVFNLRRKLPHEKVERLRYVDGAVFDRIASKMARFAEDYSQQVRLARPALPEALSDREQDNWEPLLAIAQTAGPVWVERATKAALALSNEAETPVSTGNELLADIQAVFEQKRTFKISTVDLIEALVADEEKAWATFNRGRPLSPRQLAKQLAAYGIQPKTVRMAHGTPKGYDAGQFADPFARYLAAPEKLLQRRNAPPETAAAVADDLDCCGVADTADDTVADDSDLY